MEWLLQNFWWNTPLALWIAFGLFVIIAIGIDFFALEKQGDHTVSTKEATIWSIVWVVSAGVFAGLLYTIYTYIDPNMAYAKAMTFTTGYVVEKALALDNLFVFFLIFASLKLDPILQKRALMFGVLGAMILRAILIGLGAILITKFSWILYVFGAFLIYTGWKMFKPHVEDEENSILNKLSAWIPHTTQSHGHDWSVNVDGKRLITPIGLSIIAIAIMDIVFAVDSIPAIFAITSDPFIVLTSNMFAVLGLRALYFLLAHLAQTFKYLSTGMACILIFIGLKMLMASYYHVPVLLSLGVIASILMISIAYSIRHNRILEKYNAQAIN